jgi:hypothetical protein
MGQTANRTNAMLRTRAALMWSSVSRQSPIPSGAPSPDSDATCRPKAGSVPYPAGAPVGCSIGPIHTTSTLDDHDVEYPSAT